MVSKQIIDSDAFLDMSPTSQLLYFHLIMRADDEGFVGNPKKIMREIGIQSDDFKILIAKRFLIAFESGVVVIKHWLIHNTIRMDRFNETAYLDEKNQLDIKQNKAYTEMATTGIPSGNQMEPQVKLSKVNISKIVASDTPFSLKEEIQKLEDSPRRDLNIIALYLDHRKPDLQTREQYQESVKRHLKSAGALKHFTDNQILKALDYAKKEYKDIYTLETLIKILTK